jgi:hypothetical protein
MFNRMIVRMAERAVPPGIDPEQERVAAEAAENAIRETTWIAAILGLLLLLGTGIGVYAYLSRPGPAAKPAAQAEPAPDMGGENARLVQATTEMQRQVEELTAERDGLRGRVVDLEKQLTALQADERKRSAASEPAVQAPEPAPKPTPAPARVTESRPPRETRAQAPEPTRARTAPAPAAPSTVRRDGAAARRPGALETSAPETYLCGDGRTVPDPAACKARTAPTGQRREGQGLVTCGDGRRVVNPAECRSSGG